MADALPLLLFPKALKIDPPKGKRVVLPKMSLPGFETQAARFQSSFDNFAQLEFNLPATLGDSVTGLEPETVLVFEVLGSVADFQVAVFGAGLDWIGEIEIDDVSPTEEFSWLDEKGMPTKALISRRLFLSLSNQTGLKKVLSLWEAYKTGSKEFERGLTKWRDVFDRLNDVRRWGIQETLIETSMLDVWRNLIDPVNPVAEVTFQIEFFYRKTPELRRDTERAVRAFVESLAGRILAAPIDIEEIEFHAIKAAVPGTVIAELIQKIDANSLDQRLGLFFFAGVMYFRLTGQSYFSVEDSTSSEVTELDEIFDSDRLPVAAILDGAPLVNHALLRNRVLLDDVFDIAPLYQPGERQHGTSMASLVIRGDLNDGAAEPIDTPVFFIPILQPDNRGPNLDRRSEHIPDNVFLEDRIHIAVRRLFEGTESTPPAAPTIKIINISIGDLSRPFLHSISPLARLLDWLSWRYRVLFCVSAGNFLDAIQLGVVPSTFLSLTDDEKVGLSIKSVVNTLSNRRLLSPAESINSLTIGSTNKDHSPKPPLSSTRVDIAPVSGMFSIVNRLGMGFKKSIKPDFLMPGGNQLYQTPVLSVDSRYVLDRTALAPGMKVATDGSSLGALSATTYSRGTSNATALATRGAVRIERMLRQLDENSGDAVADSLTAVMLKTLLVHSAKQSESVKVMIRKNLKTKTNGRKIRELTARFVGYGEGDIERVLACKAHRATAIAAAEISESEIHGYLFPIPVALAGTRLWRRLTITLSWLTPINPRHRNLREAKLEFGNGGASWTEGILKLTNEDADHHQMKRGTVQHEVLAGKAEILGYVQGDSIRVQVVCKKDATSSLDMKVPYGLAVTLEVKEDVNVSIYAEVKAALAVQIKQPISI